jgi:hypothetical protein
MALRQCAIYGKVELASLLQLKTWSLQGRIRQQVMIVG